MRAVIILLVLVVLAWLLVRSATQMPGRSYSGALPPLTEHEQALREELRAHVGKLAGQSGERNLNRPRALEAAAQYIAESFRAMGYDVHEQAFDAASSSRSLGTVRNIEVELRGASRPEEIVLLGAHYDSEAGTPGANDNASGVAALLALAREARAQKFDRTVRFVAFVNEEMPYFQTNAMGSLVYAREARRRGDRIVAMLSLETMGYYSEEKGSQSYPPPFSLMYPDTGNFITFVGNYASRAVVRRTVGAFRRHTRFPSEGAAPPGFITGVGWSDHWSFWQQGYPGVMVTDTALFRYPQYHTPRDTPEILDYDRLARVVSGLTEVIHELASGK